LKGEPNPACPHCYGEGYHKTTIADTTKLDPRTRKLSFTADVFNVFNKQEVLSRQDLGETDPGVKDPVYNRPIGFQQARSVRLGVKYDFSL